MEDRKRLTESVAFKCFAFFLVIVMVLTCLGSGAAVLLAWDNEFYEKSPEEIKAEAYGDLIRSDADNFLRSLLLHDTVLSFKDAHFAAYTADGTFLAGTEGESKDYFIYEMYFGVITEENSFNMYSYGRAELEERILAPIDQPIPDTGEDSSAKAEETFYIVKCFVSQQVKEGSRFYLAKLVIDLIYGLRYSGIFICAASFITGMAFFVYLMCAAGKRHGFGRCYLGPVARLPFDVVTAVVGAVIGLLAKFIIDATYIKTSIVSLAIIIVSVTAASSVFLGWCIDVAARIKRGKWWKNTIIYYIISFILKTIRSVFSGIRFFIRDLPLIWKAVAYLGVIGIWGFLLAVSHNGAYRGFIFVVGGVLLAVFTTWCASSFQRIRETAKKLKEGDLSAKVDTEHFFMDMKDHGDDLNSLGDGMTKAVEERLKSERFKTELITNVSHDIKTPLTSIINYADLISKEPPGSDKIGEYTDVLLRQGKRLKKLIEDLMEASKASTGNVEVDLKSCDASVFLIQTMGEYDERLKEAGLEFVFKKPDHPVYVMADTRHLWRVMDNLMNNICKYALENTRVYVSLELYYGYAEICLKNISKYPLDIDADELMERFVRGDSSRHTEGSGLGLAIARSLTELQGGKFDIAVDGDLFKVSVFLKYPENSF